MLRKHRSTITFFLGAKYLTCYSFIIQTVITINPFKTNITSINFYGLFLIDIIAIDRKTVSYKGVGNSNSTSNENCNIKIDS